MGSAPVLVALPGTLCAPGVFDSLAAALKADLRVEPVSWLTWPGPWDIPALASRLADHIGATWGGPVLVCGHSTGGAIALQLAARHPGTVDGLVLADTGAHMRGHGDVGAILDRIRAGWGEDLRAAVLDRSFARPLPDAVRARFLGWAAELDPQAVYDVLASQRDLDLTAQLSGITQPAAVVHGAHDRARSPEQGRELARSLPDATFWLAGTGHTPVWEAPEVVAAATRDVLARAGGAGSPVDGPPIAALDDQV
jgi:pimeloyl-ACP methyl ester carboxylesterase